MRHCFGRFVGRGLAPSGFSGFRPHPTRAACQKIFCHPERSEGSRILWLRCPVHGILHRCAVQNDIKLHLRHTVGSRSKQQRVKRQNRRLFTLPYFLFLFILLSPRRSVFMDIQIAAGGADVHFKADFAAVHPLQIGEIAVQVTGHTVVVQRKTHIIREIYPDAS